MKTAVLGGGVIGVTTAYQLALAGHEVEVIERQPGPALETSYANAGEISPGYSSPWAAPGVPLKAIKWLAMRHAPLAIRLRFDIAMLRWGASMLANCTAARYAVNKSRMVRLAEYSRDCMAELRAQTGIRYDERMQGTLQLFRTAKQVADAAKDVAVLRDSGVAFEELDTAGCVAAEPALAQVRDRIAGGLRLPGDETGDCRLFTERLAALAAEKGVKFRYGARIDRINAAAPNRIDSVTVDGAPLVADAYVLALGSYSPLALRPLGVDLPVYPVKGYSLTLPIVDESLAPVSTVLDETFKVATTRLGDRIRVGGTAELAGYDLTLRESRRATLLRSAGELFPGGDESRAEFWCGLRPMTPDGAPVVGPTPYRNLFLNTGHGTLGWTMACGSARVLADLISGRQPDIDMDGLTLARYL